MKVLLDTHLLLWAAGSPQRLPKAALAVLKARDSTLLFSAASVWEVVIKTGLGRSDFQVDAQRLRHGLLLHGYEELPITGEHALAVRALPSPHKDPFDRILLAQAQAEGLTLLTMDRALAACGPPCKLV
ncbi:MAG: type II toxin-antitoxin system VapC family toxin [Deltaproteobacteria bacterium]|nr:type II toxin-antitoxin system VapC family toxin [Deltaproteobacteria bacterium]